MPRRSVVLLLLLVLAPFGGLASQDPVARIAPPGVLRIGAGGSFTHFTETFGARGVEGTGRIPYQTPFSATLTGEHYIPLDRLESRLFRLAPFSSAEGEEPADPDPAILIADGLRLASDRREVPFTVELGLLERISLAIRMPLVQTWIGARGLTFAGGNVGTNPDAAFNRALVAGTDTALIALASGRLLPLAGTAVGARLQDTVRTLTGGELRLPEVARGELGLAGLDEVPGLDRFEHMPGFADWRPGDLTLSARVEVVNTIGAPMAPRAGGGVRLLGEGGIRIATGRAVGPEHVALPPPDDGLSGLFVAASGEAFLNPRVGLTAHARHERLGGAEVGHRLWVESEDGFPPEPSDQTLRWEAGNRTALALLPRFQVADEIALFGRLTYERRDGERYEVDELDMTARRVRQWAIGAMYSTLRGDAKATERLPFEVVVQMSRSWAGAGGAPATRTISAEMRFYPRLWGARGVAGTGPAEEP